ncbi:hypothetical protein PybrP1_005859 [[Pythium] brassicae (nom. inval.)]|nr:hypothetical protein PybrP1_005859 [[Pythium] brassicae (nom. inval.)]
MAMAASSGSAVAPANAAAPSASSSSSSVSAQSVLGQFDAKINQMGDYPAKDTINALTKLAERLELAQDIVSFLETKIHRACA